MFINPLLTSRQMSEDLQDKIVEEASNILDHNFTDFNNLAKNILETSDKEKYRLNTIKLCKALGLIRDIEEPEYFEKYKTLFSLADNAKTQLDYNIIFEEITDLGDKLILDNFEILKTVLKKNKKKELELIAFFCIENRLNAKDFKTLNKKEFSYENKIKPLSFDNNIFISLLPKKKNERPKKIIYNFVENLSKIITTEIFNDEFFNEDRLIIAYTMKTKKMDKILSRLTKEYCAAGCESIPVGCCDQTSYYFMGINDKMVKLQEKEAKNNGWLDFPSNCRYHTSKGCKLKLFKSPICLGFICDPLEKAIRDDFACDSAELFIADLKHLIDFASYFAYCDSLSYSEYFEELFKTMDSMIANGNKLVEIKESYSSIKPKKQQIYL